MDILYIILQELADFIFGGFQRYFLKNQEIHLQPSNKSFSLLEDSVLLHIFSYLDAGSLIRISKINKRWLNLANDTILWRKKLFRDCHTWNHINHITNPNNYLYNNIAVSMKEAYFHCAPHSTPQTSNVFNSLIINIPIFFRNHLSWSSRVPKFCLIGPGMDIGSEDVIKNIIIGGNMKTNNYSLLSLSNGNATGFGGGFILKTALSGKCCLIPLFTSTKSKRDHVTVAKRLADNCLYQRVSDEGILRANETTATFLASIDGIIYIIEDDYALQDVKNLKEELNLLSSSISTSTPLLILALSSTKSASSSSTSTASVTSLLSTAASSSASSSTPLVLVPNSVPESSLTPIYSSPKLSILSSASALTINHFSCFKERSCYTILKDLSLDSLFHPWQISKCDLNNMNDLIKGLDWLIGTSRYK